MKETDKWPERRFPRIIIVNCEEGVLQAFEILALDRFKDAAILTFQSPEEALHELLRADPDLLIMADVMPRLRGKDIIERLLPRQITYPIVLTSALTQSRQWVQRLADSGLEISYLELPCTREQFHDVLRRYLGRGDTRTCGEETLRQ